ncbi:MAG TPA: phytanoyl-CoA dioxygenase family protein [Steroidobacteraceae bacterium]|nr:phytanoyl-CoA dioxygenase family protein [Steroidobacteraceae bacterium]
MAGRSFGASVVNLARRDIDELRTAFAGDGVACIRGALDATALELAERTFQWSLDHPGPSARQVLAGRPGAFYQDHANPDALPMHLALLRDTGLAELAALVLGSESLWLLYEQIWLKQGGDTLRTPWHQDLPYIPLEGNHVATMWVPLDPVRRECALEFVRASHRGPLFNPTAFDPDDPAAAMYADGVWPPLPDVESDRAAWPIVAWAVEPGDVILFHMAMLHGGAPTRAGERRRTISLRFFGDHAYCAGRPESGLSAEDRLRRDDGGRDPIEQMAYAPPGSLFRHPGFARLR